MQKIFSQEIKFKADDGSEFPEWVEKKLGDVFSGIKGQGLSKGDIVEDGINKCILYGQLYTTYDEIIKDVVSKTNSSSGVKSLKGDLLVPCSTTTTRIDLADVTALYDNDVLLGGDITILRFKKSGNSTFFAYYLTHYKKHDLAKYGQGSTIVHMYYSHFKNMLIKFPSLIEEQTKIANFLSAIDSKIEQVIKQLEHNKEFKKGLLQQMFV
ncbi:restriction endonuclease subunit S [Francisellaceae bacterium CB300]